MFSRLLRFFLSLLQVAGYTFVFLIQCTWFLAHGRRDKVGEAFGRYGKWTVDALINGLRFR